jgi:DNA-directed RNA polymerase specialized sigma24 family protein
MPDFWSEIGDEYRGELLRHLEGLAARASRDFPDLLQDLAILLRNHPYPDEEPKRKLGFLKLKVRQRLFDLLRGPWYRRLINIDDAEAAVDAQRRSDTDVVKRLHCTEVLQQINALPKKLREPFLLMLEGLDAAQIAERLGYKEQTVANLLTLGRKELGRRLGLIRVKGSVTDGIHKPIAGARLFFRGAVIDSTRGATTDARGAFRCEWLECGRYLLKCHADSYSPWHDYVEVFTRMKPLRIELKESERSETAVNEVAIS